MTVTLYHLYASMRACVRTRVCTCVCGGGFLDIPTAGVRLKRLHSFYIQSESEKNILFISDIGRGSSVGSV